MKKRILIVEDEVWQAEVFVRQLAAEFDVTVVSNGQAAILAIDDIPPDLIVLDLLLSGSTAFALIHELKSHSDLAAIPIILITNLAEVVSDEVRERYDINEVIDKAQLNPRDIRAAIMKVLS